MKTLHRAAIKLKKYQNAFRYVFYLCILVLRICCTKYNKTNKLLLKKFNEEYVAHFLRSHFSMTKVGNPENPIWLSNQGHINTQHSNSSTAKFKTLLENTYPNKKDSFK